MPFAAADPTYVPRARVVSYLEDYARTFELAPDLGVAVERIEPKGGGGWRVTTSRGAREHRFVVIATGYNDTPNRPALAGEQVYGGKILHSADYRSGAPFAGKRVLVVGSGNTGGEIAVDSSSSTAPPPSRCRCAGRCTWWRAIRSACRRKCSASRPRGFRRRRATRCSRSW